MAKQANSQSPLSAMRCTGCQKTSLLRRRTPTGLNQGTVSQYRARLSQDDCFGGRVSGIVHSLCLGYFVCVRLFSCVMHACSPIALSYDAHMQHICECHMGIIWYLMRFAPGTPYGFHMAYPYGFHMFSIWMTYDNRQMDTICSPSAGCHMSSIWNTCANHVDMPYGNHMVSTWLTILFVYIFLFLLYVYIN